MEKIVSLVLIYLSLFNMEIWGFEVTHVKPSYTKKLLLYEGETTHIGCIVDHWYNWCTFKHNNKTACDFKYNNNKYDEKSKYPVDKMGCENNFKKRIDFEGDYYINDCSIELKSVTLKGMKIDLTP